MKFTILTILFGFLAMSASAQSSEKKLLTMEKNHNPENVMMIHTQTDKDCKFVISTKNNEKNYVEFYWIMNNGKSVKEVHSMIRSEIKNRLTFKGLNSTRDSFRLRLNDLSELKHDLTDTSMEVVSEIIGGKCFVRSILTLGASAKYRKMDLNRTYCEVSKNLIGIPNGCNFLELEGKDIHTGENFKVRFKKK